MKKTKLYIITFASVALILSGCGKKGDSSSISSGTLIHSILHFLQAKRPVHPLAIAIQLQLH